MNYAETLKLVSLVKVLAPAQKFEEFTAEAWCGVLEDESFQDARAAVKAIGKRQAFIAPADIIAECKIIRRERGARADATFVFDGDPDDTHEYKRQLIAHRKAIMDGSPEPELPQLVRQVDTRQLANTFRSVPPVPHQVNCSAVRR